MTTHSPVSSIKGDRSKASSWCATEFYESKIYFNWKIKNFLLCRYKNREALRSSIFSAPKNESLWCLRMYPNGVSERKEGYVSLFLGLVSSDEGDIVGRVKFWLCDKDMKTKNEQTQNFRINFIIGTTCGFEGFIKRDYLLDEGTGLLSGSDLNIGCVVYITHSRIVMSGVCNSKPLGGIKCDLSRKLGDLFHSQKYCDVILRVNGRKFNCHKAILAARSPVFSAMFEHEMQERNQNEVFITDVDEDTMEAFLQYIYTGKVEAIDKFAPGLLTLSDKYDIPKLNLICQRRLLSTLSAETAIDILSLADKQNAKRLKEAAIMYFVLNAKAIKNTLKWQSISDQHPALLKELIDAFAELMLRSHALLSTKLRC